MKWDIFVLVDESERDIMNLKKESFGYISQSQLKNMLIYLKYNHYRLFTFVLFNNIKIF